MSNQCKRCGSYAINHHSHGRDGSDGDLCDVCYWRKRAECAVEREREACAKVCKEYAVKHAKDDDDRKAQAWMMLQCAAAIRARSQEKS